MSTDPSSLSWLTLYCLLQQADQALRLLIERFGTPEQALAQSPEAWRQAGLSPRHAQALQNWQQDSRLTQLDRTLEWLSLGQGRQLLTLADADYPRLLREIPDPPPLLFLRGRAELLGLPQIAIVGSRHPSQGGLASAQGFAQTLGACGLTITSGLALGIDGAAHRGALQAQAGTIAVLGTGPDRLYPRSHHELALSILDQGGLILSEFLPGTPPLAPYFPRRNRIISGLALGVLVVEAALESGSLITARLAGEQGRNIWALPGSVHNPLAKGCHTLIRDGAKLVEEAAHILEDLEPLLGVLQQPALSSRHIGTAQYVVADDKARQVLEALAWERRSLDWLVETTGLATGELGAILMDLELAGQVATVAGGYERLPA